MMLDRLLVNRITSFAENLWRNFRDLWIFERAGDRKNRIKERMSFKGGWCMKYSYGGQALIEGVMMNGRENTAIAVRKADGTISVRVEDHFNGFV